MSKSKITKLKEISEETKKTVMERQHYKSITGVALSDYNVNFHHVVGRGQEGVGLDFNIVAITFDEHRAYHDGRSIKVNGRDRYTNKEFETLMKNHLKLNYVNWSEDNCKIKKYWDEEDYRWLVRPQKPF